MEWLAQGNHCVRLTVCTSPGNEVHLQNFACPKMVAYLPYFTEIEMMKVCDGIVPFVRHEIGFALSIT